MQEAKVTREPRGPKEDTRVTKGTGARVDREVRAIMEKVTKGTKEEVKEDMEARRVTKEEVKEGTRDGTSQEVTRERREEVKDLSHTLIGPASNAEVKDTSPRTAEEGPQRCSEMRRGAQRRPSTHRTPRETPRETRTR